MSKSRIKVPNKSLLHELNNVFFIVELTGEKLENEVLYSEFGVFSFSLSENKRLFKRDLIMEPEVWSRIWTRGGQVRSCGSAIWAIKAWSFKIVGLLVFIYSAFRFWPQLLVSAIWIADKFSIQIVTVFCFTRFVKINWFFFSQNYKLMAAVLCSALYPNIVQILTPELRYKKTASGALCKAHTADEIKVTYLDTFFDCNKFDYSSSNDIFRYG